MGRRRTAGGAMTITFPVIDLKLHGGRTGEDAHPDQVSEWLPDFVEQFTLKEQPSDRVGASRMIAALLRYVGMRELISAGFIDRVFGSAELAHPGEWSMTDEYDGSELWVYEICKAGSIGVYETTEDWVEDQDLRRSAEFVEDWP